MKILHIITSLGQGGAESALFRLVSHDSETTHKVVSLSGGGFYLPQLIEAGIPVLCLNMSGCYMPLREIGRLFSQVSAYKPDVIQTWMYHADLCGAMVGVLTRLPVVWGVRNTSLDKSLVPPKTRFVARVCGFLSKSMPQLITVCAHSAALAHVKVGYDGRKMRVIHNGYDSTMYGEDYEARSALRAAWDICSRLPLIGMIARDHPVKDHENFLNALGLLMQRGKHFQAVLVGPGMSLENDRVRASLTEWGLQERVRLIGPREDVPAVMQALDLHVLSSVSEAFPNVVAEAMASGTPCVVTDVGDAGLIVGRTGWVVPPRDAVALANAMEAALDQMADSVCWSNRKMDCRSRISGEFGLEAMVNKYRYTWAEAVRLFAQVPVEENVCAD